MFYRQLSVLMLILLVLVLSLLFLTRKFGRKDLFCYLLLPLVIFVIGFSLRLTSNEGLIDLGFYFTEIAYIFLTILFVLALLLGQVKYWKK